MSKTQALAKRQELFGWMAIFPQSFWVAVITFAVASCIYIPLIFTMMAKQEVRDLREQMKVKDQLHQDEVKAVKGVSYKMDKIMQDHGVKDVALRYKIRGAAWETKHPMKMILLMAIESSFDPGARSTANCLGLTQCSPGKFRPGEDWKDIKTNVRTGARYFERQLKTFGRVELALAAYNAGPGAVQKYGGIPPYEETVNYIARYKWIERKYGC
jgi:hypothetical protein